MVRYLVLILSSVWLCACTSQKVVELDAAGYYPGRTKATVVLSKPFDLDSRRDLMVVPTNDFLRGELTNIHYFKEVMTFEELQKVIIKSGLTDKVPTLSDLIGINSAAKYYKPFLYFHVKSHGTGAFIYTQFIVTDALTLDDLFIAETHLDFLWTGVNDQNNWYPMFNAFIDYIRANSKTYGK
jgi:hypothetical protein